MSLYTDKSIVINGIEREWLNADSLPTSPFFWNVNRLLRNARSAFYTVDAQVMMFIKFALLNKAFINIFQANASKSITSRLDRPQVLRDIQNVEFHLRLGRKVVQLYRLNTFAPESIEWAIPLAEIEKRVTGIECEHDSCNSNNATLRGGLYYLCDDCDEAFYLD